MEDEFVKKCITIRKDQKDFLADEKKEHAFKLSKFVQNKLDEFIKLRAEYKEYLEG